MNARMRNERVIAIWGFLSLGHSIRGLLTFRHVQWMCYRNVGEFLLFIFLFFIPREARLINQSGRRPEGSESRANSSEKYIYIHIFIYIDEGVRPVAWQQWKHSLFDVREREGC